MYPEFKSTDCMHKRKIHNLLDFDIFMKSVLFGGPIY